jgi:spore germination protein KB
MRIEKGKITSSQLMFLIAGFIQGSTLTITFAFMVAKQDAWLTVLFSWLVSLPFVLVSIAIAQKFPRKNLVQINDLVYGPYLGKLVSAFYLGFVLIVAGEYLRYLGEFILTYIMPETPIVVILIMFTFVCAWAARSGIEVTARYSGIFIVITSIIVIFTSILLVKDMKLTNFLPVLETPLKDFIRGTHIMAAIPFGEIYVFLMIIPYLNEIKQTRSSVLRGFIIGGATLLIITVRDIAVLGVTTAILAQPSFEAVRLIEIAKIITRLEIFVAIALLVTMFLKVSVFYYVIGLGTAQVFNLRSYVPLVPPIGIILITFAIWMTDSAMEQVYSTAFYPFFTMPFEMLLPSLTLLIAKVRGLSGKQGGEYS